MALTLSKVFLMSALLVLPHSSAQEPYVIAFDPAPNQSGYRNTSFWSWGGGVVVNGTQFHLFASAFVESCGLNAWGSNSVAIHAVAASPLGPFAFVERALPFYHHNVAPIIAPDGTVLIFSIGMSPEPALANCSTPAQVSRLQHGFETVECWWSPSVDGPWTAVPGGMNGRNLFNGTNPAPAFDPSGNGTLYVMSHNAENMTVSTATSWRGPYSPPVPVFTHINGDYQGEDPFIWFDPKLPNSEGGLGAWRVLYHMYNKSDTRTQVRVGGYAVSSGPNIFGSWWVQPNAVPAYTTSYTAYESGSSGPTETTVFSRRERPKLFLDPTTGKPSVLYSGVCPEPDGDSDCFTIAAPIAMAE